MRGRKKLSYDELRAEICAAAKDLRVRLGEDTSQQFAEILSARIAARWPEVAGCVTVGVVHRIDQSALGHSDYGHKVALRLCRAVEGVVPFRELGVRADPWAWERTR